jgi:outer membrane receptor for ferrienterochelin and colicin
VAAKFVRVSLFAGVSIVIAGPALSQPGAPTVAPAAASKRVYTPADFARFAPRTAYDMLVQVPSFTIHAPDPTERGLGQASENVLINGQRINNKNYAGGAGGAVDQLQRTPAGNVERIEIVDAAALGIAGLSGQVANFILKTQKKGTGQFEWRPDFRAHYSKPNLYRGSVSYDGHAGPVDYTLSVKDQAGRGAFGGPILIYDGNGTLIERRTEVLHN